VLEGLRMRPDHVRYHGIFLQCTEVEVRVKVLVHKGRLVHPKKHRGEKLQYTPCLILVSL